MAVWYVYLLVDTRTGLVFYVGKGKERRCYVHVTRAKRWVTRDREGRVNAKLYNKINSILSDGFQVEYVFVARDMKECDALLLEQKTIADYGVENLCNLTHGGEGETRTADVQAVIARKHKAWRESSAGRAYFAQLAEAYRGENNPMWGRREDEEHKMSRMKNMLVKPRWNMGLTGDPRCKGPTGKPAHNRLDCQLTNVNTRQQFVASSLQQLAEISGISLSTINRLRAKTIMISRLGWRFECLDKTTKLS